MSKNDDVGYYRQRKKLRKYPSSGEFDISGMQERNEWRARSEKIEKERQSYGWMGHPFRRWSYIIKFNKTAAKSVF